MRENCATPIRHLHHTTSTLLSENSYNTCHLKNENLVITSNQSYKVYSVQILLFQCQLKTSPYLVFYQQIWLHIGGSSYGSGSSACPEEGLGKGEKFLSTFLKPYLVLLLTIAPQRMLHSMTHTLTSQGGKSQATEAPPPLPPPLPPPPPLVPASVG